MLRFPMSSKLSASVRTAIRTNQAMVPAAATTTRSLALDILSSTRVNKQCAYHTDSDKHGRIYDKAPGGKYIWNGVPKTRLVARKVAEGKENPIYQQRLDEGYLHCGCKTDHALLDFYFWKTLTLTGTVNGREVIERVPRWTPRERAFILKIFERYTFLTIDDLYTKNLSPELHEETLLQTQLERILERYNELRIDRGLKKMALVIDESDESVDYEDEEENLAEWGGIEE